MPFWTVAYLPIYLKLGSGIYIYIPHTGLWYVCHTGEWYIYLYMSHWTVVYLPPYAQYRGHTCSYWTNTNSRPASCIAMHDQEPASVCEWSSLWIILTLVKPVPDMNISTWVNIVSADATLLYGIVASAFGIVTTHKNTIFHLTFIDFSLVLTIARIWCCFFVWNKAAF